MNTPTIAVASMLAALGVVGTGTLAPAVACPDAKALGNFLTDNQVSAAHAESGQVSTYVLTTINEGSLSGAPGLIEYCVYPHQPPANPNAILVNTPLLGADGGQWVADLPTPGPRKVQGFFSFQRPDGDKTNIAFDGKIYDGVTASPDGTTYGPIGTATWPAVASCTPQGYNGCPGAPTDQTILLHVNDANECAALYNDGSSTCWVYPGAIQPPQQLCLGQPACKSVTIDPADDSANPAKVPGNTLLHLQYTYTIVNQSPSGSGIDMIFNAPTKKTQDINSGGGKDYFGCEQQPASTPAQPGGWTPAPILDYQGTGFSMSLVAGSGSGCPQSRMTMVAPTGSQIVLHPTEYRTFTVDMVTRTNKGGKQEYTSCGQHLLNSGFTVKWFWSNNPSMLQSYSTNITPISVNVVTGGKLSCP